MISPVLIRRKPLFLIRYFLRIISDRRIPREKRRIRSILFHTHYKCNLNCAHCYEKNFTNTDSNPLSLEEKKRIITDCLREGALAFDFVSGESSIDPDLSKLVQACKPHKTYITLATNGYDLSTDRIRSFSDVGIDKLNVSLDSWFAHEHDAMRRKEGAYRNAFRTISSCKRLGMGIQATTVVYRDSTKSDGFKKLVEYAIKNRIRLTFKAAVPLGKWEAHYDNLISEDDKRIMFSLHREYPFLTRTCIPNRGSVCPAFDTLLTVTAYGDVLPCNTIHISYGNLRNDRLSYIIKRGRSSDIYLKRFKGCPPAESYDFIQSALSKTYGAYPYPAKAEYIFKKSN